jgi:hypothetical protein
MTNLHAQISVFSACRRDFCHWQTLTSASRRRDFPHLNCQAAAVYTLPTLHPSFNRRDNRDPKVPKCQLLNPCRRPRRPVRSHESLSNSHQRVQNVFRQSSSWYVPSNDVRSDSSQRGIVMVVRIPWQTVVVLVQHADHHGSSRSAAHRSIPQCIFRAHCC